MSDVFGLDQAGQRESDARSAANPISLDQLANSPADFWEGIPSGVGEAVPRALVKVARGAELAGSAAVGVAEPLLGKRPGELTDTYFGGIDPTLQNAVDYWTPTAREVGTAGQVLGGLTEGLTELALGGGNPALMLGTTVTSGAMDLARAGVNPDVAVAGGVLEGAANAAGFKIPFLGKTLLTRIASGAAGNLALGRGAALAQQQLLEQTGYPELAKGYNPFDMTGAALDTLMGVAWGVHAHLTGPVTPLERDAANATLNAKHFQQDTAPGTPATVADGAAHQEQIEASIKAILAGERVAPSPEILEANFIPREATPPPQIPLELQALDANRAVTAAADLTAEIPRSTRPLSPEHRAIETRFAEQLGRDPAAAEAAYNALEDAKGGKVLNVDTMRELSPDYLKDRTTSAAVHEPASWAIKRLYARKLTEAPAPGEENLVLFTGGGTGAGKSSAVKEALGNLAARAQIVYDTNLDSVKSAIEKIDLALAAGKRVRIAYVFRDPVEALQLGALTRAMRQERQYGSGRTVPIETHIDTHANSNAAIREIAAHYANDPRVEIGAIDNTRGKGNSAPLELANLPKIDYNSAREGANQTLDAELAAGRISPSVYAGFKGAPAPDAESAGLAERAGGQPQSERQQGRADSGAPLEPAPVETPVLTDKVSYAGKTWYRAETTDAPHLGLIYLALNKAEAQKYADGIKGTGAHYTGDVNAHQVDAGKVLDFQNDPEAQKFVVDALRKTGEYDWLTVDEPRIKVGYHIFAENKTVIKAAKAAGYDSIAASDNPGGGGGDTTLAVFDRARIGQANQPAAALAPPAGETTVYTSAGRAVKVAPQVVEASSLVTSDNPDFPQELQPRQRGARTALSAQVATIAQKLEPELLGESATSDTGAPITGPGGVVESGNGRVMALREVYAGRYPNSAEKAAAYRAWLEAQGYDTSGLKEPILVRQRSEAMTPEERRAFTIESNKSTAAELSPVELAQSDAALLDAETLGKLRGEDLTTDKNGEFRRSFLNKLPVGERNSLLDATGNLSQAGEKRIRAAILAKAYGGTAESNVTLGRILESTADDMRGALGALQDAAPMFARLRQMIADGKLSADYDIAPAVLQAFEEAAALKRSGTSLTEHLATGDMFSRKSLVIKKFYDEASGRLAPREKVAGQLEAFARQAMRERVDQSSLFSEGPLSADQILTATAPAPRTSDMFGLRTPQGKGEAAAPDPDVAAAQQMLEQFPKLRVATGEFTPEGAPIVENASEVMARTEADIAESTRQAQAYQAAVDCALQRGV